jgi:hypothetical protein
MMQDTEKNSITLVESIAKQLIAPIEHLLCPAPIHEGAKEKSTAGG